MNSNLIFFADDVSYFLSEIASIKELLRVHEQSKQFTALRSNCYKSETSGIGFKKGAKAVFSNLSSVNLTSDSV